MPSTLIVRLFQLLSTEWPPQHLPVWPTNPGFGRGRGGPNSYELKMKNLRQTLHESPLFRFRTFPVSPG
jgi:hypothetical protein